MTREIVGFCLSLQLRTQRVSERERALGKRRLVQLVIAKIGTRQILHFNFNATFMQSILICAFFVLLFCRSIILRVE